MLPTRDPPQNKGHIQTESKGLEKDTSCRQGPKKAGVTIIVSDKIDFEKKAVKRDKERHYMMIKGSVQEGDKHRSTPLCKANANKYEVGN